MKFRIALSVLPVVLVAAWLSVRTGREGLLPSLAIWTTVSVIAAGVCALLGRAAGASDATPLWITCLAASVLLAGFCALTILSIGMLIAPLAIALLTFSLVNLAADFRHRRGTR